MIDNYVMCVETELMSMIQVYNKHVVPRCIEFSKNNNIAQSEVQKKLFSNFNTAFDELLNAKEKLEEF